MKIVFMGTPDFAATSLAALVDAGHEIVLAVTQPDKPKGRGNAVSCSDVKQYAVSNNIPVFQPTKIREDEAVSYLKNFPADIFVVAAFGQILPREILEMPRLGCVNVHASLLPKYRGASPIQWAILNGEKETGVTIMQMGEGLDDGDILSQKSIPIAPDETGGSLFDKLAKFGGELLVETLPKLERGEITPMPQDPSKATKVGLIRKELGRISFSKPAAEIERYIRGLYPWPTAYTTFHGKTLKLLRADVLSEEEVSRSADWLETATPGTVLCAKKQNFYIQTGDGILALREVQPESKKRMDASAFLNGTDVKVGETLG